MEFDDVFTLVGNFGAFQIGVFAMMCAVSFFSLEVIWTNFTGYTVDHFCRVEELGHLPHELQKYIAIPWDSSSGGGVYSTYSKCEVYQLNYSAFTETDFLNWNRSIMEKAEITTKLCDSWVYDQSLFRTTIVSQFDLVCGRSWLLDLVSSITLAGSLAGALAAGAFADRFGRQRAFITCLVIKLIGAVVVALCKDYYGFLIGRFIQGFGTATAYQTGFVIVVELVGPNYRNLVGVGYSIAYSVGYMSLSAVSYLIRDYTRFMIARSLPMVIMLIVPLLIPESPRWLMVQGRRAAAAKVLKDIAAINGKVLPEDFNLDDIKMGSENEKPSVSPLSLVRTPRMRRISLILFYSWFTCSLIFFALSLGAGNLAGDVFVNSLLLGSVEIPSNLLLMWIINVKRIGRRFSNVLFFLISGFASIACVPVLLIGSHDTIVTVLSMIGKGGSTAAFNLMYVYSAELFPTEARSLGLGASSMFARASGLFASYAGNSLSSLWLPLPSLLFGITGTLAGALGLLLPETLGKKMPATVEEVENQKSSSTDDSSVPMSNCHKNHGYDATESYGKTTETIAI